MTQLFKLGLVSISFRPLSVEELIRLVTDVGLEGIEWGGDKHVPHGDLDTARRVRGQNEDAWFETAG
jgi:3-dehydroshikimate dehydratase